MEHLHCIAKGKPVEIKPGIYPEMDRATYDAIPAFNQSILKKWIELGQGNSPAKFKQWLDNRDNEPVSDAMIFGALVDCLLLDSASFTNQYITLDPDAPRRPTSAQLNAAKPSEKTIEAIAYWQQFDELAKGRTIIDLETKKKADAIIEKITLDEDLQDILANCKKAVAVTTIHGLPVKCEFDFYDPDTDWLFDLKTTDNLDDHQYAKLMVRFGYNKQAAWYLTIANTLGIQKRYFGIIAAETEAPYILKKYSMGLRDIMVAAGQQKLERAMLELNQYLTLDLWPEPAGWKKVPWSDWDERTEAKYLESTVKKAA